MLDRNKIPAARDGFYTRELGDEMIIISESGKELHSLNEVGTFIWKSIDGIRTIAIIIDLICDEFDIARDTAAQDLDSFLNELEGKNLISLGVDKK